MTLDVQLTQDVQLTPEVQLTPYEHEVAMAMTARRDSALRLRQVIDNDIDGYDLGMDAICGGHAMEILVTNSAGRVRQEVSDAVNDFEAARHRFRLALVAVAVDNGLTARQIGEAFTFSRQLASRYLKEARAKWPALQGSEAADAAAEVAADAECGPTVAIAGTGDGLDAAAYGDRRFTDSPLPV